MEPFMKNYQNCEIIQIFVKFRFYRYYVRRVTKKDGFILLLSGINKVDNYSYIK